LARHCALKGLIYAAATFPGESHNLPTLLTHLEEELKSQILSDGGHISRNPQVHLTVLRDLIDIRAILRLIKYDISPFLQSFITKMAPIVRFFRHGDGKLAHFGATISAATSISSSVIDMVLSLSDVRGRPPEKASALGFERCNNKGSLILLNVGAKTLSNKFSDLEEGTGSLNFEWSVGRDRIIVQGDLVLQTYEGDRLQVPHLIKPKSMQLRRTSRQTDQGGHTLLEASYTHPENHLFQHRRHLYLSENPIDLRGEDNIKVTTNTLYGIRFILSKGIEASVASGGRSILLNLGSAIPFVDDSLKNQRVKNWRFLMSGADEAHCETYENHKAIILIGRVKTDHPACIQWAFRQE
jgi:uncharacterized heparinase superfamily protein